MNKSSIISLSVAGVVVAFLAGILGGHIGSSQTLGGDFAGGITPSLHGATTTGGLTGNGYIYANGSLADDASNGLSIGGSDQYHGLTAYVSASGTPLSAGATLGALGTTTSTATTTITIPESAGLAIGAICSGGAATTTVYISGCVLTATNGVTGTSTVAYSNITNAAITVPSTTLFRITFDELPY